MLPSVGPFQGIQQMAGQVDEGQFNRIEAIINSMTKQERDKHEIISGSRRKRIARGSGTSVQEVNQLLRQYAQMRKMFKSAGKGGGGMQRRMMGALGGMRGMGRCIAPPMAGRRGRSSPAVSLIRTSITWPLRLGRQRHC